MGYAEELLSDGERIIAREKQHWFVFVAGARFTILAVVIAVILAILSSGIQGDGAPGALRTVLNWSRSSCSSAGSQSSRWTTLRYLNQEYILTNRRVIQLQGVLNKTTLDSGLEKINDAALSQSIFGRMFGFGDLEILTASDSAISKFHMIIDPIGFKKAILNAKHEYDTDMAGGFRPAPPIRDEAASTGGDSTADATVAMAAPAAAPATAAPGPGPRTPTTWPGPRVAREPARPRGDQRRGVRGEEGGACSDGSKRLPYPRPVTRCRLDSETLISIVIVLAIMLLVGFPVHEFAHAFAAYRLGDGTAKLFGRLTPTDRPLRPDRRGPAGGVLPASQGARVRVGQADTGQPEQPPRAAGKGEAIVAAAGPLSNLVLALAGAIPLRFALANAEIRLNAPIIITVLDLFVQINIILMVFNLIPIPPLDGPRCSSPRSTGRPSTRSARSSSSTGSSSSSPSSSCRPATRSAARCCSPSSTGL